MFSGLMSRCTMPWRVGRAEGVEHLAGNADGGVDRELALAAQPIPQRLTLDVRHDIEEERPEADVIRSAVVQRQDVGMLEAGGEGDLPEEALPAEGGAELRAAAP